MPIVPAGETTKILGPLELRPTTVSGRDGLFPRTFVQEITLAESAVRLDSMRVWDDLSALLPGTPASDDLGIIEGTFGTDAPTIQTGDAKAATVTRRMRFQFPLPKEYIAGQDVQVQIRAGMVTTISDSTATVDVEAYAYDGDGAVGSDLCTTAAQTINSLVKDNRNFVITATALSPGDVLDVRVTVAITDSATATAVIGEISKVTMLLDAR